MIVTLISNLTTNSMAEESTMPSCSKKVLSVEGKLGIWKRIDSKTSYSTIVIVINVTGRFHLHLGFLWYQAVQIVLLLGT